MTVRKKHVGILDYKTQACFAMIREIMEWYGHFQKMCSTTLKQMIHVSNEFLMLLGAAE